MSQARGALGKKSPLTATAGWLPAAAGVSPLHSDSTGHQVTYTSEGLLAPPVLPPPTPNEVFAARTRLPEPRTLPVNQGGVAAARQGARAAECDRGAASHSFSRSTARAAAQRSISFADTSIHPADCIARWPPVVGGISTATQTRKAYA
jgi:hypothetical protein